MTEIWQNSTLDASLSRDEDLAKIEIIIQSIILILALIGNGIVLAVVVKRCRGRGQGSNRMLLYIGHLAVADLAVALGNVLPQLAWDVTFRFRGPDTLCRLVKFLQMLVIYAASGATLLVGYDRYLAVCKPFTTLSWSRGRALRLCTLVWICATVFALPQVAVFARRKVKLEVMDCWAKFSPQWTMHLYVGAFVMIIYFIPLLVLVVLYLRITCTVINHVRDSKPRPIAEQEQTGSAGSSLLESGDLSKQIKKQQSVQPRAHNRKRMSAAKLRTLQMTFVVVLAYLLCWSPFVATQLLWTFTDLSQYNHEMFTIFLLLASLNSCVNPFVYLLSSGYCNRGNGVRGPKYNKGANRSGTSAYTTQTSMVTSTEC